jgi:hypothetical protein
MEHYVWENLEKEVLGPAISLRVISGERITLAQSDRRTDPNRAT